MQNLSQRFCSTSILQLHVDVCCLFLTGSCGYCGYTLNLSSSTRNTANIGSKYGKQIKKGIVHSSRFFVLCALKSMVATIPKFLFLFDLYLDTAGALLLRTWLILIAEHGRCIFFCVSITQQYYVMEQSMYCYFQVRLK